MLESKSGRRYVEGQAKDILEVNLSPGRGKGAIAGVGATGRGFATRGAALGIQWRSLSDTSGLQWRNSQ